MSQPIDQVVAAIADDGSWELRNDGAATPDPLSFPGYADAAAGLRARAPGGESVVCGAASIGRYEVELALFDFTFFGGSMGEVAGERLASAVERAADRQVPFVVRTATGGARMQEGMRSLVQMPKLVAARMALEEARQPFIAILGHPTTGGVLAGFAGLADITIAESGATVGFAGPRIVESFTGESLSEDSHRAESALSNGLVDEVVDPVELREHLTLILMALAPDQPRPVETIPAPAITDIDPWDVVNAARSTDRILAHELLLEAADAIVPLRGDRAGGDDPGLDVAVVRIAGRRALAMSLDRQHPPGPRAYRKARRALHVAQRLGLPVVTLIDTRGADPSESSEAGGIAWEIAQLFDAFLRVNVPTLAIVTGEGGSGGALAFATTDRLLAYELGFFSVIGPEMAAEILWRDGGRAEEAARMLRLTATDLVGLGIVDGLLPEPLDASSVRAAVVQHLDLLGAIPASDRAHRRRERWRARRG